MSISRPADLLRADCWRGLFAAAAGGFPAIAGIALMVLATQPSQAAGALQSVGSLICRAKSADTDRLDLTATSMDCKLEITGQKTETRLHGQLFGGSLDPAALGGLEIKWDVFAPTADVDPGNLVGDYDAVSKHDLKLSDKKGVLVGGANDAIALELIRPERLTVNPSSRLTLARQ